MYESTSSRVVPPILRRAHHFSSHVKVAIYSGALAAREPDDAEAPGARIPDGFDPLIAFVLVDLEVFLRADAFGVSIPDDFGPFREDGSEVLEPDDCEALPASYRITLGVKPELILVLGLFPAALYIGFFPAALYTFLGREPGTANRFESII